jgi:hypothetical protein
MNIQKRRMAALLAALCCGYATQSYAQDPVTDRSTYVTDSGRVVHCVSTEGGRTYCGRERMRYAISGTPAAVCVEGRTWGFDDRGVWVSGGCVADFNMLPGDVVVDRSAYLTSGGGKVHCVSTANGRTYCGPPNAEYLIKDRTGENLECVQGRTWGVDERGLWVSGGCVADFDTADSTAGTRSAYVNSSGEVVHCVANPTGFTHCGTSHQRYEISGKLAAGCVEGHTWGRDENGVWVTGACNADFVADNPAGVRTVVNANGELVRCVSTPNGRTYCGAPHRRYVLGPNADPACIENSTWGVDDRGVWVSGSCTADFRAKDDD